MASLDDLKKRIASVKSTQKITKAMKMVAAAKLRRAQESAEKGRPYSEKMNNIILNLSSGISDKENALERLRIILFIFLVGFQIKKMLQNYYLDLVMIKFICVL